MIWGMAGGRRPFQTCKKPGKPGFRRGDLGKLDVNAVFAALVRLNQLAPFRLCLEQIRHPRTGRASLRQDQLSITPGGCGGGGVMEDPHHLCLDSTEGVGPIPQGHLAEVIAMGKHTLGRPWRSSKTMLRFGSIPLFPANYKFFLLDHNAVFWMENVAILLGRRIEVLHMNFTFMEQFVDIVRA
uniref:Uncharacterized protein n=2 Tax=Magnetospirillum gryphiswaldense TaxID=55518 RepID=Q3BKF4_9PROT|nr:hypothetical protein mgI425 [Magnetospirillum gryphiswaldense MSR-1]CAM77981.1 hypothetical protein MGR_4049 [Magnetospirillum gryphiswaldense MSR-1]